MSHILKGQEAREKLAIGIQKLEEVVRTTLGPDGDVIYFEREIGPPMATKDGVTVAAMTHLKNDHENMGANLIKLAAQKTAQDAGDGTTTSTILANYLIQEGVKNLAKGGNARHLATGIEKAVDAIIVEIKKNGKPIKASDKLVENVALVSSNYDEVVSKMIADTIKKIGKDGVINIIQSMGEETSIEHREGMYLTSSYVHPAFINKPERNEVELNNVAIILTDYEISSIDHIYNIYVPISKMGRIKDKERGMDKEVTGYLFMAKEIIGEGLQTLLKSKVEKGAPFCAVKPPWGDNAREVMEDIAVMVGAQVVSEDKGFQLDKANAHKICGWAEKVIVTSRGMTIIGANGPKKAISDRLKYIENRVKEQDNAKLKTKLKERIARMKNGIAQIKVGGPNEPLMKERAFRVEDAIFAVKAALEEGVTVGGGVSYIRALVALEGIETDHPDQQIGINIVREAVKEPIKAILSNSGYSAEESYKMIDQIKEGSGNHGFNARTKEFEDLFKAGVINPVKVDTKAIKNASEVTQQFLKTGAAITILDNPNEPRR